MCDREAVVCDGADAAGQCWFRIEKFMPAECYALGQHGSFSGVASSLLNGLRGSSADDLIGVKKDFLSALFRYCFGVKNTAAADPVLYYSREHNRFPEGPKIRKKEALRIGFDFTQTAGRRFVVRGTVNFGESD